MIILSAVVYTVSIGIIWGLLQIEHDKHAPPPNNPFDRG